MSESETLQEGDSCPNCGAESYGDRNAITEAVAGNLMCRHCGHTFPNKEYNHEKMKELIESTPTNEATDDLFRDT